ncbi:MAG: hypothetical protein ACRDRV_17435 [Pseudonocardiaceae bacterium]
MTTLTTGWEPDTATTDTFVRQYLFGWAEMCAAFTVAAGGRTTTRATFAACDYRRPAGYFNSATLLAPPRPDTIDEIEEFFAGGSGETLLWSAWPTPDLRRRGWQLEGHPPLLIRPPAATVPPPSPTPTVTVEQITTPAGLADWERVVIEGYPLPELLPPPPDMHTYRPGGLAAAGVLDDPRVRLTVSREEGRAVGIGTLFVSGELGLFALGVTRPEARRRGHWLSHAVHRLAEVPQSWTAGVFSDYSRSPAQRLGFVPVLRLTLWSRSRRLR